MNQVLGSFWWGHSFLQGLFAQTRVAQLSELQTVKGGAI